MKVWLSPREIAEASLPATPGTERAVQLMAQREGWNEHPTYARARAGRGGGTEYHFRLLPTLAQVEWMQRHMNVGQLTLAAAQEPEEGRAISGRAAKERDARLALVAAFERFHRGSRLTQMSALQVFCDKYNLGSLAVEDWVKDLVPRLAKRALQYWIAAKKDGRTDQLAVDRGQARKGTGVLDIANDGQVRTAILTLLAQNAHYSAAHIRAQIESLYGPHLWVPYKGASAGMTKSVAVPPVRTFQAFIAGLKRDNKVVLTKLTDPDKYRSTMAPAGVGALRHISAPNQLWQIDASPVDALCTDGRHSMYACIDIYSRRAIVLISKTPRSAAVALLMRKAIMAWGVPDAVKTDNGSDFVSQDTKRLLISLDIEQDISDAYSPQQKGHVERFIHTFQHDFAPLLPGFVGHNVADRKAIENRKSFAQRLGQSEAETFDVSLTGRDVQRFADLWVKSLYEQRPHHGLQGMTPLQKWNSANYRPRTVDVRALDLLLMPVAKGGGIRTTTKLGIRVEGYHYATPEILPGVTVMVRQDPEDLGRVFAFEPDGGRYLGEGVCPELAGVHPATFLKAVRQLHTEAINEVANPVRKMLRDLAKGPTPIERALQIAADDASNVVPLIQRPEEHTTPEIDAALVAMGKPAPRQEPSAAALFQTQLLSERVREVEATGNVQRLRTEETPPQRYQRARDIEARLDAGAFVEERELGWLQGYRTGSEYRSMKMMDEDFGDQANR